MPHVSLVTLGVADLDRATAFYEALGWRRSPASVDGVVAFMGGSNIALSLFGLDDMAADARIAAPAPDGYGNVTLATNQPSTQAVDEVMSMAEAAGATVLKPAAPTDWGGHAGCFADPDGHVWEVAHNPGFPLAPDGSIDLPAG